MLEAFIVLINLATISAYIFIVMFHDQILLRVLLHLIIVAVIRIPSLFNILKNYSIQTVTTDISCTSLILFIIHHIVINIDIRVLKNTVKSNSGTFEMFSISFLAIRNLFNFELQLLNLSFKVSKFILVIFLVFISFALQPFNINFKLLFNPNMISDFCFILLQYFFKFVIVGFQIAVLSGIMNSILTEI